MPNLPTLNTGRKWDVPRRLRTPTERLPPRPRGNDYHLAEVLHQRQASDPTYECFVIRHQPRCLTRLGHMCSCRPEIAELIEGIPLNNKKSKEIAK
jgi:hypothetical protein